jgi:hypothetical protein
MGLKGITNKKLHHLCFSPDTVRVIKAKNTELAWHVACKGEKKCVQNFGAENYG